MAIKVETLWPYFYHSALAILRAVLFHITKKTSLPQLLLRQGRFWITGCALHIAKRFLFEINCAQARDVAVGEAEALVEKSGRAAEARVHLVEHGLKVLAARGQQVVER